MTTTRAVSRRNLYAFAGDYIAFAVAMGFLSMNIILPAFAAELGASSTLVGTLVTVLAVAWGLPQVFIGNVAARFEHKKPMLVKAALIGRPFTLIVPIVIVLTKAQPAGLVLMVIMAAYSIFFMSDAFASVGWMHLMSRVFPPERRGSVISRWQLGKAVGLLGVSALVGVILGEHGPAFPFNYLWVYVGVSVCLLGSTISLFFIDEPAPEADEAEAPVPWKELGRHLSQLWKADLRFRRLTITRVLFSLSTMAFPFYVIYATDELHFSAGTAGLFILAQTVGASLASILLGRMADQRGAQRAIQIGGLIAMSAPVIALIFVFAGGLADGPLRFAFAWIYVCMGLADNLMMLGYFNYLFDVTPKNQRSMTMGAFNALSTIGVLGPIIAGWLLQLTSFAVLFVVVLMFALAAQVLAVRLPPARSFG